MRSGAADFVTKPWTNQALLQTVQTALRLAGSTGSHDLAPISREDLDASYDFDAIVTADPRLVMVEAPGHPYFAMACLSARAAGRADRCFRKTAARKTEAPGPRERPCPNPPLQ